jgi:hypothetical protein
MRGTLTNLNEKTESTAKGKSVAQSIMKTVFNISNNVNHPPGGTKLRSFVVQILLAEIVKKSPKP